MQSLAKFHRQLSQQVETIKKEKNHTLAINFGRRSGVLSDTFKVSRLLGCGSDGSSLLFLLEDDQYRDIIQIACRVFISYPLTLEGYHKAVEQRDHINAIRQKILDDVKEEFGLLLPPPSEEQQILSHMQDDDDDNSELIDITNDNSIRGQRPQYYYIDGWPCLFESVIKTRSLLDIITHLAKIWKNYEEDQPQTARTTWKEVEGGSSPQNTQKNSCNSLDQHEEKASNVHYICDGFETIRNCIVRVGKGLSVGSKYGLRLRSSSSSCILHHKDNNQLKEYYDEQEKEKKYCCKEHSITSCDVLLPGVIPDMSCFEIKTSHGNNNGRSAALTSTGSATNDDDAQFPSSLLLEIHSLLNRCITSAMEYRQFTRLKPTLVKFRNLFAKHKENRYLSCSEVVNTLSNS
mmetsp:Transcript_6497/g.9153  ORF Transcript_6497/g.9153 Transcript_6497/m.9153 type:complete len:405 (-) Transcript_6497:326-1540(-)